MAIPTYGAAPLAKTFLVVRLMQLICFVIIVGVTANFVAQIVASGMTVLREIVGTLVVTCLAAFYTLITLPFFFADASFGLFIMCGIDFLMLIAFVVVAVVLGRPLSYLNCFTVDDASAAADAASAFAFTQSIATNIQNTGNFLVWVGTTRTNCFEAKGVWGLSIALCILFFSSTLLLPALFAKKKRAAIISMKGGDF